MTEMTTFLPFMNRNTFNNHNNLFSYSKYFFQAHFLRTKLMEIFSDIMMQTSFLSYCAAINNIACGLNLDCTSTLNRINTLFMILPHITFYPQSHSRFCPNSKKEIETKDYHIFIFDGSTFGLLPPCCPPSICSSTNYDVFLAARKKAIEYKFK